MCTHTIMICQLICNTVILQNHFIDYCIDKEYVINRLFTSQKEVAAYRAALYLLRTEPEALLVSSYCESLSSW